MILATKSHCHIGVPGLDIPSRYAVEPIEPLGSRVTGVVCPSSRSPDFIYILEDSHTTHSNTIRHAGGPVFTSFHAHVSFILVL